MTLDSKIPGGLIAEKWTRHRFEMKLVSPANKRKYTVIVVGSGLAGGAAGGTLAGPGEYVLWFWCQGSPRRRLPLSGGECPSTGRGQCQHHRPVRRARGAVCA